MLEAHGRQSREITAEKVKRRARALLDRILTPEQRQEMERSGRIPVTGKSGRRYHVFTNTNIGNIVCPAERKRWCIHVQNLSELPKEDNLAAQILHLQADDTGLLLRANAHPYM